MDSSIENFFYPDDTLYLAHCLLIYFESDYKNPFFLTYFPPNRSEKFILRQLDMIFKMLKIPFNQPLSIDEVSIEFDENNFLKILDFSLQQAEIFSKDKHLEYAKDQNHLSFSTHQEIARKKLNEFYELYGNSFVVSEDDFGDIEGFLFIHCLNFLYFCGWIEIDFIQTQNSTREEGLEIYSARIALSDRFFTQTTGSLFFYDPQKGLGYKKNKKVLSLSDRENRFCAFFYDAEGESYQVLTTNAIIAVYGDTEGENEDALKSVVKRLNKRLKNDFSLAQNPIKFGSYMIKKEI